MRMGLTRDEHRVKIGDHEVAVTARTGPVHANWKLLVDDAEVDSAAAAGDFKLRGHLPDGTGVEAQVHQSLVGPTEVVVLHDGTEVGRMEGFVA
jgi:hypothetical protein